MDEINEKKQLLIVDDIESIRMALCDYLEPEYRTWSVGDGFDAIEVLKEQKIDLVLSDIRMPGMGGLQLFQYMQTKAEYKDIIFILMTAYNVDEYLQFTRENKIWNVIPKSSNLDLRFVKAMITKLLTGSIFGIQKYYSNLKDEYIGLADLHRIHRHKYNAQIKNKIFHIKVSTSEQNSTISDMISDILYENGAPSVCRMILEELSANAIIHAPRVRQKIRESMLSEENTNEEIILENVDFDQNDAFELGFGFHDNKIFLSVIDFHGTFDKQAALSCLERQTKIDPVSGLPIGLIDYHGRGLFISREQLDQLIFNISEGEKTEIIGILSKETSYRTRAISIFQT